MNQKIVGIDNIFINEISKASGIVENYKKYKKILVKKIDYTSNSPEILKARIVEGKMCMVIEIADTFSWLCSILNKINSILETNKFKLYSLDKKLTTEYIDKKGEYICPTCKKKDCKCVFYF